MYLDLFLELNHNIPLACVSVVIASLLLLPDTECNQQPGSFAYHPSANWITASYYLLLSILPNMIIIIIATYTSLLTTPEPVLTQNTAHHLRSFSTRGDLTNATSISTTAPENSPDFETRKEQRNRKTTNPRIYVSSPDSDLNLLFSNDQCISKIIAAVVIPVSMLSLSASVVECIGLFKYKDSDNKLFLVSLFLSIASCQLQPLIFFLASSRLRKHFLRVLGSIVFNSPPYKEGRKTNRSISIEVKLSSDVTLYDNKNKQTRSSAGGAKKLSITSVNPHDVQLDITEQYTDDATKKVDLEKRPSLKPPTGRLSTCTSDVSNSSIFGRVGSVNRKFSECSSKFSTGNTRFLDFADERRSSSFSECNINELRGVRSVVPAFSLDKSSHRDYKSANSSPIVVSKMPGNSYHLPPIDQQRRMKNQRHILNLVGNAFPDLNYAMPEVEPRSNVGRISTITTDMMVEGRRTSHFRIAVESYDTDTVHPIKKESDTGEMVNRRRWLE